jgi:pyruvate,water dikinase
MTETQRNVTTLIDLTDPVAMDAAMAGGKAAGLARMVAAGLPVPPAVVVPVEAADGEIESLAVEVVRRFGDTPLAVRSSCIAEDLANSSYAGQYESVLNVSPVPEAVTEAVHQVRASAAASRVRSYHAGDVPQLAVLLMPMIEADAAGIAFTRDPVTGRDVVVIEAVAGIGDRLAAGEAPGERWTVGDQPIVDDTCDVLTQQLATEVARLARRAERVAGGEPQDIEWAITGGSVVLLQARPITALPIEPRERPPEHQTWVRNETHTAGAMTRLGYSAWLPRHTSSFAVACARLGLPVETIEHGLFYGRVYDRVRSVGAPSRDRPLPPAPIFRLMMRLLPAMRERTTVAAAAAAADLPIAVIEEWEGGGRDSLRSRTRELRHVDLTSLDDKSLAGHLDAVLEQADRAGTEHFTLAFAGTFILTGQLGMVMEELLGWEPARVVDLVQGHGHASTEAGRALEALRGTIEADAEARRLLAHDPGALPNHPGSGGIALRDFLDRFGHRVHNFQLNTPTWAEDPRPLLTLLTNGQDAKEIGSTSEAVASAAEEEARAAIADRRDRVRFDLALERARRGRPFGDETECDVWEVLALVRYVAIEASRRFLERRIFTSSQQVFHLSCDELGSMLRGAALPSYLDRREAEYRWALANEPPALIGPPPQPIPGPELYPKAMRQTGGAFMWALGKLYFGVPPADAPGDRLRGLPASPGRATAPVRIVRSPESFDGVRPGEIMVCPSTTAAWSPIFPMLAGIVTEHGGPLSHPATLAREYGLPAVLSVPEATVRFTTGQVITIDGGTGEIED